MFIVLQSESVNNVCKLLQLLGNLVPQIPYRGFVPGSHWGLPSNGNFRPQTLWALAPKENSWDRHWKYCCPAYLYLTNYHWLYFLCYLHLLYLRVILGTNDSRMTNTPDDILNFQLVLFMPPETIDCSMYLQTFKMAAAAILNLQRMLVWALSSPRMVNMKQ